MNLIKWAALPVLMAGALMLASCKDEKTSHKGKPFTSAQQAEIKKLVRETLIKNPEILQEAIAELDRRDRQKANQRKQDAIARNADAIFRSPLAPVAGNANGKVTIVEFFDYNCPYCGRAFKHLENVMKSAPSLRIVFKEYPIFGGASVVAARAALAARKQGKYFAFHKAMLESRFRKTESMVFRIARQVGLDMERLKRDMKNPQIDQALQESNRLAAALGVRGTPAFLVGDKMIPGAPRNLEELMMKYAADIKKNGCKHC